MKLNDLTTKDDIKANIRRFREDSNLTQTQIAVILGLDRTTYTKWESGDTLPNAVQIARLATIFDKSIEDFFRPQYDFTVCSSAFEDFDGSDSLGSLSKKEKVLLAKYRMLGTADRAKVDDFVEFLRKQSKSTN